MKNNQFAVLLGTLVVLLVVLLVVANPFAKPGEAKPKPLFPALHAKEPVRIEVSGLNKVKLWKQDGEWLVEGTKEGEVFPADTASVQRAIRAAKAATMADMVSQNPEKQGVFQVDTTGTVVKIFAADSSVLAHFVIGKSGTDYATNYVRPADGDRVYLVGERIKTQFDRSPLGLREMFMVRVPKEEIVRCEIVRGDTIVSAQAKDDQTWELLSPVQGTLKKDYATRLLNTLSNFRGDELVLGEHTGRGFENPFLKVSVVLKNGTDRTILVGDTTSVPGRRYARVEGSKWLYEIGAYRIETLTKPVSEIIEPPPAEAVADTVPKG